MTTIAEHLRNTLDGRWRDVKNQMRERLTDESLPSALHTEHGDRPHQSGRADEHHGRRRRGRRRLPQRARRQRQRRRGDHDDRDARDVGSVADGQGGRAVGPVRRGRREPRHRAPPRGVREEDHQPRAARLLRDDRDRTRQRRPGAGDDRDLRRRHRRVRDPLRDSERAQGLHRRCRRNRHDRSGFRATHHHRERRAGQPWRALLAGADPRRRRQRPAGRDHVGLSVQGWPAGCRQRSHRVRPRSGPAGEPAEQIRRRRGRRHLQLTDRKPQPPVLHHDRHPDPRTDHRRRQRGQRGAGGAGHRDPICVAAQAVQRARRRRRSADHGLPGASAPAVPADREVVRVAVRAERAGGQVPRSADRRLPRRRGAARAGVAGRRA